MLSKRAAIAVLAAYSVFAVQSPMISVDEFVKKDFDYLVLGGGTAGLVVAARYGSP